MAHSLEYLTHYVIQGICISGLISYMFIVAPRKYSTLTFLSLFEIFFSSEPDIIESPTMTGLFLLQFWRFVFELRDIWGFFICINLFCCFWQNWRNWFSILFICFPYPDVAVFLHPDVCRNASDSVWYYYMYYFRLLKIFLVCVWKRSTAVGIIWESWKSVFL